MRKFKVGYGKPKRKKPAFTPEEEIKVLQGLLKRFIQEEKYELAEIVQQRIDYLTTPNLNEAKQGEFV